MIRLYFYVEGQTEQEYVKRVLAPHLAAFDVQVMGAVLAASGRRHGHVFRGGGMNYQPMRNDLGRLLRQEHGADVRFTTLFDLYALYSGFPGWDEAEKQRHIPLERVRTLEKAFAADVGDHRFIAHIQLYELETILLCDPSHFALVYEKADDGIAALRAAVVEATSPELVNDGEATAPFKADHCTVHAVRQAEDYRWGRVGGVCRARHDPLPLRAFRPLVENAGIT
jgi:hypothetical protein